MGESPFQTPHSTFPGWLCTVPPLHSTDLNSSIKPVDTGGDPSFSFYLRPAAILGVNSVLAPLFHGLRQQNKQWHDEAVMLLCARRWVNKQSRRWVTMRRAWLMFHVSVVMVLFWGSTIESSMMYAELAICFGRYRSIQRGDRLVLVNRRLEMRQLVGVTSRKMMSSVKTWLLWEKEENCLSVFFLYWIIPINLYNVNECVLLSHIKFVIVLNIQWDKIAIRNKTSIFILITFILVDPSDQKLQLTLQNCLMIS